MIEDIEELSSELKVDLLSQLKPPAKPEINLPCREPA